MQKTYTIYEFYLKIYVAILLGLGGTVKQVTIVIQCPHKWISQVIGKASDM